MYGAVALIAESGAVALTVDGGGGVVAILAKGERGDSRGEIHSLVGSAFRGGVLLLVAFSAQDAAVHNAEDDGGRGGATVANRAHAYQPGHVLARGAAAAQRAHDFIRARHPLDVRSP